MNEDIISEYLKELQTPFAIKQDNLYYIELRKKLKIVIDLLTEMDVEEAIIHDADNFRNRVLNLLREYFKGHVYSAQASMISMVNDFIKAGEPFVSGILDCEVIPKPETEPQKLENIQWFKARLDAPEDGYTSDDMRHVPFNQREILPTYRYSMPGIPCFYLGNTSYDCWIEMGKPSIDRFYVSPVRLKKDFKIFCLATSVRDIVESYYDVKKKQDTFKIRVDGEMLKLYIRRLMLMIASSFRIKQDGRNFKSEYVIPQLIMLACSNKGLDGLISYTVKASNEVFSRVCGQNLTLFAKYPKNKFDPKGDYSDIMDDIEIFDAYGMASFEQLEPAAREEISMLNIENDTEHYKKVGSFRYQFDYSNTKFCLFDRFLFGTWDKYKTVNTEGK